jgi:hypothetical protein
MILITTKPRYQAVGYGRGTYMICDDGGAGFGATVRVLIEERVHRTPRE